MLRFSVHKWRVPLEVGTSVRCALHGQLCGTFGGFHRVGYPVFLVLGVDTVVHAAGGLVTLRALGEQTAPGTSCQTDRGPSLDIQTATLTAG